VLNFFEVLDEFQIYSFSTYHFYIYISIIFLHYIHFFTGNTIKDSKSFQKKNFLITDSKPSEFKTNMKKNIEAIYENSCFKMDLIFSLEFDKKKYYENLKQKSIQEHTNNSND